MPININEIMGTFIKNRPINQPFSRGGNTYNPVPTLPTENLIVKGLTARNCNTLEGWQNQIVRALINDNDQYVIARPGGGKTLPIICYWMDRLLGLNTMKGMLDIRDTTDPRYAIILRNLNNLFRRTEVAGIPKMLITVPVISLAQQTGMELRRDLASIFMQYYNYNPSAFIASINPADLIINSIYAQRGALHTEMTAARAANQMERLKSLTDAYQTISKSLIDEIYRFISEKVNELVYIRTGESTSTGNIDHALAFVSIYESVNNFIDRVRNLQLVVLDEAHLIQDSGVNSDDQDRSFQISGQLYRALKSVKSTFFSRVFRRRPECRLVLLTGTINPASAQALTTYMNRKFNRNFPDNATVAPETAANRSQIAVVQNESIRTTEGIVNSIIRAVHQNDWGQLYIIFSAKGIASLVNMCIDKISPRGVENQEKYGYEPTNTFGGLGSFRKERERTRLTDLDRLSIPPGMHMNIANITNPLLRQCVLRGIGFIFRKIQGDRLSGQEQELKLNDSDKMIVAKLFKERKINVLLATDAVGIGVNIDVKQLFIPSLEKFSATVKGNAQASLRDLAQILNRAGRGSTPIASIQTPKENMEMVNNAFFAGPTDFPEVNAHRGLFSRD